MGADEQQAEVELAADSGAARQARAVVDRVAAGMPGDLAFRARLSASELVANSVAHAVRSPVDRVRLVVLRTGSGVRVEVRDGGEPFAGEARVVSERATSGRGLWLVDALVDRWGAVPEDGNLVWFEIDQPAGGDRDRRTTPAAGRTVDQPRTEPKAAHAQAEESVLAAALLARAAQCVREGWCQGTDALDMKGRPVEPWSEQAAAWSLLGALVAALDGPGAVAAGNVPPPVLATGMAALGEMLDERSLAGWNDAPTRTQRDVIEVLERARMLLGGRRVTI